MLAVFLLVLVDEREEVNDFVVEGFAVEWGIVVTAIESDVAFDETIVEIELTILFKAGIRTNKADVVWFNIYRTIIFVVVNAHRKRAVIRDGRTGIVIDLAV